MSITQNDSRRFIGLNWAVIGFLISGLALLAGCAYAILYCASGIDTSGHALGSDDAYISYRYAQNLVNGHGLVFNPGERVEGYTNLLYVLLMTVPFLAGWDVLSFSVIANSLFALAALIVFFVYARRTLGERAAALAALLFAFSPSLWIWVSSGLETPLVFLLQVAIWTTVERADDEPSPKLTALLCIEIALLTFTRADGFIMPLIAIAYLFVKNRRSTAIAAAATLLSTMLVLFGWRLSYYQDIWPNTYYAKVADPLVNRLGVALRQFVGIAARQGHIAYLAVIGVCLVMFARQALRDPRGALRSVRFDLWFSCAWICYWLYIGGDVFEDRFLIILTPIGIALLFRSILASSPQPTWAFVYVLALLVQLVVPVRLPQYGKTFTPKYDRWVDLGQFLAQRPRHELLAIDAAGKVPFFSGLNTIDMHGLTDRHIGRQPAQPYSAGSGGAVGHNKLDPDYVLSRSPTLISSWISETLDLGSGLPRQKYEPAGYRLWVLVNTAPYSRPGQNIVEVQGRSDDEIVSLVKSGYNFAVAELVRSPELKNQ
jgi:hypothetical protein